MLLSAPRWGYATSKLIDEFLTLGYWKERRVSVIIARFFNTVGPRQSDRYGMVIPNFVRQALAGPVGAGALIPASSPPTVRRATSMAHQWGVPIACERGAVAPPVTVRLYSPTRRVVELCRKARRSRGELAKANGRRPSTPGPRGTSRVFKKSRLAYEYLPTSTVKDRD